MIFLDKGTENKWKCRIFVSYIMSETQEIKDGLTASEETEAPEDATYDHIVKYTGFLGGIQVLTILVNVVRNKLAAVLLGTAGVGLSALYQSVIGFLHNTSNLGISFSSIKEIAEFYGGNHPEKVLRQVEVVRTWSVWTGGAGMLLCLLLSPAISYWAFGDTSHILSLCLLSPVMGFMAVTVGEISILKAVRRLKRVAVISVLGAAATLLLTIPFYCFWGISGVVLALVVSTFGIMVVHLCLSLPVFPWCVDLLSREYFRKGWSMVRVGVPYIMAMVVNMSVGMGISLFITNWGSLSDVGLYGMGYNLVFAYAGVVFTAVEADYFPRLSSVHADAGRMNLAINRQIKVCVLLMSPFLVLFMISMPLVVRLLYTSSFLPMTGMAVCASMHMFFKSMTLPVAYTSLAKGDAVMYLCMEAAYDIFMAVCVMVGFVYAGILGTGIALALAGVFDWWMIYAVYGRRYGFKSDKAARSFIAAQFLCVAAALYLGMQPEIWLKVAAGGCVLGVSVWLSASAIRKEITLFSELKRKIGGRFGKRRRLSK